NGTLDFDGGNVLSARDDDVLLAVDDVDVAVFVPDRHVAGVQPAIGHHLGGGLGLPVVALHDVVAAHDDFADLVHVARDILHVGGVYHSNLAAGDRPPRHGELAPAILCLPVG